MTIIKGIFHLVLVLSLLGIFVTSRPASAAAENNAAPGGAGVTVIVHGFDAGFGLEPEWMETMQAAILEKTGGVGNEGVITVEGSEGELSVSCDPWDFNLASAQTGEIVVRVNWSAVANHILSGVAVQEVAAAIAPKIYTRQHGQPPLAELPLHLIGHSRGAGLVSELARLLGEEGLQVDQVTFLDPHPLSAADPQPLLGDNVIDSPVRVYENILFADNYWQDTVYPEGQYVPGAYNRLWAELDGGYQNNIIYKPFAEHLNIVLMYYGTIDTGTPVSDGTAKMTEDERQSWFSEYEKKGAQAGFYYSRIMGAGNRLSTDRPVAGGEPVQAGCHDSPLLGGSGVRRPLDWSRAGWPNLITFKLLRDGTPLTDSDWQAITPGEELELAFTYRGFSRDMTITFLLDSDRNPYNDNNIAAIASRELEATASEIAQASVKWDTANLSSTESYNVYAEISDGQQRRYLYARPVVRAETVPAQQADKTECFIATATSGSPLCGSTTGLLRQFRDDKLLTFKSGQAIVRYYYNASPALAEIIAGQSILKGLLCLLLLPAAAIVYLLLNPGLVLPVLIMCCLIIKNNLNEAGY